MITKIEATVKTGAAGANGKAYLGICGREFLLNSRGNDFRSNSPSTFILGQETNYKNALASVNDPRSPQLEEEDLDLPAYMRFAGTGNWSLVRSGVELFVDDNLSTPAFVFHNPLGETTSNNRFLSLG